MRECRTAPGIEPQWEVVLSRRQSSVVVVLALLASSSRAVSAQETPPFVIVVDRQMTPAAGASDLLTVQRAATALEDRWLPPSPFDESTTWRHFGAVGYRFGKWFGLDLPQDHFLMVRARSLRSRCATA